MITVEQYFTKPHSAAQAASAADLLARVNALEADALAAGVSLSPSPNTGNDISGAPNGDGDGAFRTPGATTGAARSAHKEARAVDRADIGDHLDTWLDGFEDGHGGNSVLEKHGLWREHPSKTPGWCHLQTRPVEGRRTFYP